MVARLELDRSNLLKLRRERAKWARAWATGWTQAEPDFLIGIGDPC